MYLRSRSHCLSSSVSCLRVQLTASAAAGLKPSRCSSVEQYSSWLPLTHGHVHLADDLEAFLGIGVVADDVAEAGIVRALLLLDVLQDHLEGLQVGVNVGDNGKLHDTYLAISNPRNSPVASLQLASSFRMKCSRPASRMPCRKASISARSPSATNSTRPSGRLRTTPVTSNPAATDFTVYRNPTPCTPPE